MRELSQWGKDVKKAAIDKGMTIKEIAEKSGYNPITVSALINGRYTKADFTKIVTKVNEILGTKGFPPKPVTPSVEWQKAVRKAMVDKGMLMNELARLTGFTRDRVSLVVNGHNLDNDVINAIINLLDISVPVLSEDT